MKKPKRPRDPNQLGKSIIDIATGDAEPETPDRRDPAAVERGRKGGLKGGKARAASMTPAERKVAAQKAIQSRWNRR